MAEELGWELEAFDKAFREAFQEGMVKADFKTRVVWVPKALKYNKPESPNVIRSWASEWDLIPECDLKRDAYEYIRAFIVTMGEAFLKAFEEAFAEPSSKAMPNQEQEQEQDISSSSSIAMEIETEAGLTGVALVKMTMREFSTCYYQTFSKIMPGMLNQEAADACQRYPPDVIRTAFRITAEAGGKSWSYTKKILDGNGQEGNNLSDIFPDEPKGAMT